MDGYVCYCLVVNAHVERTHFHKSREEAARRNKSHGSYGCNMFLVLLAIHPSHNNVKTTTRLPQQE